MVNRELGDKCQNALMICMLLLDSAPSDAAYMGLEQIRRTLVEVLQELELGELNDK